MTKGRNRIAKRVTESGNPGREKEVLCEKFHNVRVIVCDGPAPALAGKSGVVSYCVISSSKAKSLMRGENARLGTPLSSIATHFLPGDEFETAVMLRPAGKIRPTDKFLLFVPNFGAATYRWVEVCNHDKKTVWFSLSGVTDTFVPITPAPDRPRSAT